MSNKEFKILSPTAILGYGFPESSFLRGIEAKPDLIAVDAGSVDPGPFYLGSGKSFTDYASVKRDLMLILRHGVSLGIPIMIGTAGGSGAKPHLDWCKHIIEEITQEEGLSFKMAVISADIDKKYVCNAIQENRVKPLSHNLELTQGMVEDSSYIVAQMGVEPFIEATKQNCQVVLAGRAYDPSPFAAIPIYKGFPAALALHLGKILECAAIATEPGSGADCVMGILTQDSFILQSLSPNRIFTKESTAAHSLYEKSDPFYLPGPGGTLDLTQVHFEEIDHGIVRVSGTRFIPSDLLTLKLEGARQVGFRTVSFAGVRDPIMIQNIDSILQSVLKQVEDMFGYESISKKLHIRIYGKNGIMADREPQLQINTHELGILIEAVGSTQKEADSICAITRSTLLHYGYPGRMATAGNLAFPFSPSDIQTGPVYEFSLYHLINVQENELTSLFPIHLVDF